MAFFWNVFAQWFASSCAMVSGVVANSPVAVSIAPIVVQAPGLSRLSRCRMFFLRMLTL